MKVKELIEKLKVLDINEEVNKDFEIIEATIEL